MPTKPILMSDLRRIPISPANNHRSQTGNGFYNRFEPLSQRPRLPSLGKRQLSPGGNSAPSFKFPRLDPNKMFEHLQGQDSFLAAAKAEIETANNCISASCKADDGGVGTALIKLSSALSNIISGNEALKSSIVDLLQANQKSGPPPPRSPAVSNISLQVPKTFNFTSQPNAQQPAGRDADPEVTLANKVKKTLRDAERRTTIYGLDLGPAPTINKETISRKVTIALHDKAKEGAHDWALQDAAEMIDDTLSCSQLEFLGSGTRKFYNNRDNTDKRNGKMCTVPVRMDFKNKETRVQAETTLRSICKVNCSIPYPRKLRTMISEIISSGKRLREGLFIKVKVDIDNLKLSAAARTPTGWENLDLDRTIPLDILERYVPSNISDMLTENAELSQALS